MEPPICALCHRDQRDHENLEFDLVRFRNYESIDHPGHPEGLLWFCQDHIHAARRLAGRSSGEALRLMRADEQRPRWLRALRRVFGR